MNKARYTFNFVHEVSVFVHLHALLFYKPLIPNTFKGGIAVVLACTVIGF
jgi:hypothetical protein